MTIFRKMIVVALAVGLLSVLGALAGASGIAGQSLESGRNSGDVEDLSTKIIRFHVIASGNSPKEQELKLQVRDAVLDALEDDLSKMKDIEEVRNYIKSHLKNIETIARKEVEKSGKDYEVKAFFGKFPFPVKTYGFITLPAGEYEALRIVIGEGKGKNWWCILFPPLCFVDITHGIAAEEARLKAGQGVVLKEMPSQDSTRGKKENLISGSGQNREVRAASSPVEKRKDEDVYSTQTQGPILVKFKTIELLHTAIYKLQQNFKVALSD